MCIRDRRTTHLLCLSLGGLSFISFRFIQDPHWLLLPMIGIGVAWAAILAIPYSLLSGSLPSRKMGVYMGIFNSVSYTHLDVYKRQPLKLGQKVFP